MEWIDVNQELPDEGVKVLTYLRSNNEFKIDYIINCSSPIWEIWACRLDREQNEVTHWMPLPQPPS